MGFQQQFEGREIIAFQKKVHGAALVEKQVLVFRQNGDVRFQNIVDFLPMLLKDQTVLLRFDVFLQFAQIR